MPINKMKIRPQRDDKEVDVPIRESRLKRGEELSNFRYRNYEDLVDYLIMLGLLELERIKKERETKTDRNKFIRGTSNKK